MTATIRSALILAAAALLGACASHAPPPVAPAPVAAAPAPQVASPVAHDVLFRALGLVGTPYRWGGNTPESGFDCSGLIGYVFNDVAGIALPRTTAEMSRISASRVSRDALKAGDLVFFATSGGRRVSHAGIYVGDGRFVHAPSSGGTVRLDSLSSQYWQNTYLSARRVLDNDQLAQYSEEGQP